MERPLQFRTGLRWSLLPLLLLLPVAVFLAYVAWYTVALGPLEQAYLNQYGSSSMLAGRLAEVPFRTVQLTGLRGRSALAQEGDVVAVSPWTHQSPPLALSPGARAAGWTGVRWSAPRPYPAAALAVLLREQIYAGKSLARLLLPLEAAVLPGLLLLVWIFSRFGSQSSHEERHGRRTKGPELTSPGRWNRTTKADGIRLQLASLWNPLARSFRIPKTLEASHILLMGDTGSGKSNAIRQILHQVEERGETAIVYDPAGEFVQEFYRPDRGDLILNPLDERCPFWHLESELYAYGAADAIAAAMIPEKEFEKGFFVDAPRRVLTGLLRHGPSVKTLLQAMADPAEIERRLAGTPQAAFLDRKAGPQRAGVLSSLNMIADSLALVPERDGERAMFAAERWKYERKRWVFLSSRPSMRERILPLHSVWLDLLILRMMEPCENPTKPVWFVLDELASLNKLPQLHTAVTENRKYGNPVVLGFQGRSQLEKRYGQDAEAMLSQPATKIFFKTSEPRAAKWISESLGEVEVERLRESRSGGALLSKKNFSMDITTKPLVLPSEIAGLTPLTAYIKQENRVVPVRFRLVPKKARQPEFIERKMAGPIALVPALVLPASASTQLTATAPAPPGASPTAQLPVPAPASPAPTTAAPAWVPDQPHTTKASAPAIAAVPPPSESTPPSATPAMSPPEEVLVVESQEIPAPPLEWDESQWID